MVIIEGIIVAVMETWPLQLVVQQGSHRHTIALSESVEVKRGGQGADVSAVGTGARVTIYAERRQGGALVAQSVIVAP
jgi:hypothetical protein